MSREQAIAEVFAKLDREVWLLTAQAGVKRGGLIATLVCQASIVPQHPRVWVCLAKQHFTREVVEASQAFVLHLVGEDQAELAWRFGTQSGHDVDKFADMAVSAGECGPRLPGMLATLDCRVETSVETGDRIQIFARVVGGDCERSGTLLTLRTFYERLSPDQRRELKARLVRDAAVDANLIERWQPW